MTLRRHLATLILFFYLCEAAQGGGGGENMLLVVNPNDPSALQIANAYAAFRDIPANNILFLAPPPDYVNSSGVPQPIAQSEVVPDYLTPIASAISSRGLSGQINYIGTIGEAVSYSITPERSADLHQCQFAELRHQPAHAADRRLGVDAARGNVHLGPHRQRF